MCTLIHTTQDMGFTSMNECAGQCVCQQDASSTEENLFEAFCFRDQPSEGYDSLFKRPASHGNSFMTTWPVTQRYEELDVGILKDPNYSAGPTSQCTLHHCWKPSPESASENAVHPQSLMGGTAATVEAELEEDIQREIEAELKKEISLLSQKLALLQARHGAQRMMEGPLPAVLSCPATPVLTPRDSKENNVQSSNPNESDAGAIGTQHRRRGPVVATKQSEPKSQWKANIPPPEMKQNEGMIHQDCSPQFNDYGQARAHEEFKYGDAHSLEGTPSSGSLNSNITHYVMKDPTNQDSHCPRVYPNNSRRFDWVKTLRSGETGSRVSSVSSVSSDKKSCKMPKTRRPIETKAECASKNQRDTSTGNWTNDLSDMTEMLENRLSDLAIRTTMASVQIPAPQYPEGTRGWGDVLATKDAMHVEPAPDKSTKNLGSECLAEKEYGCLDRRTVLNLMKAGLKRGPIRKKIMQSPYSKPRPVRTCNTHKDAANGKRGATACEKVSPEKQTQTDELKEIQQNTELVSPDPIKTVPKTFVKSPNDRPIPSLHCDASERLHGEAVRNGNSNILVQSNQVLSTQEGISQSLVSILGSKEKQHPVKTTYMRIIELVSDTGNQHSAKKSTHGSRECLASDKGSLSSLLMEVKHRAEDKKFKYDKGHISNSTDASSLSLHENIVSPFKNGGQETIKKTSRHQKTVSRLSELQISSESHTDNMDRRMGCKSLPMTTLDVMRDGVKDTIRKEEQTECLATKRPMSATDDVLRSTIYRERACPRENWSPELMQDQEQLQEFDGKLNRAVSSSSLNGENHKTDDDSAESSRPAISSIRARLKELIDVLEKERLRLPKIRTGVETSISTSPRDSGRVKRIAERLQQVNLKVDDTATPSDLQNNGQVYPERTARVITASCNKIESTCIKSAEVARVHDRQGRTTRKTTLRRQVLRVRRSGKQSRRANDSNIQQNLSEDIKCTKKLKKKKTSAGNEMDGLDLESIWCLVEKLEGRLLFLCGGKPDPTATCARATLRGGGMIHTDPISMNWKTQGVVRPFQILLLQLVLFSYCGIQIRCSRGQLLSKLWSV